jgi:hypothetical protein
MLFPARPPARRAALRRHPARIFLRLIPCFPFVNSRDFCGFPCSQGTMAFYFNDDLEDLEDDYFDFDGFGVSDSTGGSGDPSSPVCMLWLICCR